MSGTDTLETIPCPYCESVRYEPWAEEMGYVAVRCQTCALIYCNPRPSRAKIDCAVRTGVHGVEARRLNVRARRVRAKVRYYRRTFGTLFDDVWNRGRPLSWLDVGAGYGEVLEAVTALAPAGSQVEGVEPMKPKADVAREIGFTITEDYLRPEHPKVDIISVVDVFSHIPSFSRFLADVCTVLKPGGELFVETGNLADLDQRGEFPGELGLPDHLVFAGEKQLLGYLRQAGFDVVRIERRRIDGVVNLAKNVVKALIGRPAVVRLPYTSEYRQLLVRARLRMHGA
jgi:SAM-dependent methyltransferase